MTRVYTSGFIMSLLQASSPPLELPKLVAQALSADLNVSGRHALTSNIRDLIESTVQAIPCMYFDPKETFRAVVGVQTTIPAVTGVTPGFTTEVQTAEQSASGREPLDDQRIVPSGRFVTDGRVNSRGIAVLYTASDEETAILESRAQIGSAVTVGTFKNRTRLNLADMRVAMPLSVWGGAAQDFYKMLAQEISIMYRKPVVGDAEVTEYTITRIFADYVHAAGLDGIAYSSSQGQGTNYAFFNPASFDITARSMFQVDKLDLKKSPLPTTKIFP